MNEPNAGVARSPVATDDHPSPPPIPERLLDRVAAMLPGVLYAFRRDADGTFSIPYANSALERLFGTTPGALRDNAGAIFDHIHPDDVQSCVASIEGSARTLTCWESQFRVLHPELGERSFIGQSMPEATDDGAIVWYGFVADVTEQRRSQIALREREEMLGAIIANSPSTLTVKDLAGRYVLANPNAQRTLGLDEASIIGKRAQDFFDAAEAGAISENDRRVIESNQRFSVRERVVVSGAEIVYDSYKFPIHDAAGALRYVCSISLDNTERLRTDAAMRESDARFRQVTETIREAFWLTDVEKQSILYISPAYESIWGRSIDSLLASPEQWMEAIHPDDRERVMHAAMSKQVAGHYDEEYRIVRPDGAVRWIHDVGYPVRDESGTVVRVAGVAEDITDRRDLETTLRQSQKMESIGQLAGGVAHDFNNALTVIMTCTRLIEEGTNAEGRKELLGEIQLAAERAASLTRQLLAFSRKEVMAPKVLNLNATVLDTRRMLGRLLGEDIEIVTRLAPMLPNVKVDPGHLVQILMNLAVNARDAMPRGGALEIQTSLVRHDARYVRAHPESAEGEFVELIVRDTGIGMSPEVQARAFEPFFTTKKMGAGTGLGLSVVHGIVTQNGGTIDMESAEGHGTTLRIAFPVAREALPNSSHEMTAIAPTGGERILLVEDDAAVRRLATRALKAGKYDVLVAANGFEALELLSKIGRIDALVTDVVMPGMSGSELAYGVRAICPKARVLLTSGYTNDALTRGGVEASDVDFLQKPYSVDSLLRTVRELLDRP